MKNISRNRKLNFAALAKSRKQVDDNGRHGRCGNWYMGLGGYDMGYEIYYRGEPIGRVNYGNREYELYDEDFIPEEQIPEFLAAIDARKFKDVGHHEQDDEFTDEEYDMVNEARKQILWAVDVRNMNTAIHGLFYGPDKRQVQKFAKALAAIFSDYERGGLDDDGLQYAWDDLVVQFPDMAQMEEVNFRDFGPTSSGWKKGLEDDDYEYRIINSPAIDIYSESKRNQKMKFKKIVNEEVDIGWDLEARRDDRNREIRERQKWNDEELIFDGKPMKRKQVIMRLRAAISDKEDEGYDISPITAAIHKAQEIDAGEKLDFPRLQKIVKESENDGHYCLVQTLLSWGYSDDWIKKHYLDEGYVCCGDCKFFHPYEKRNDGTGWCSKKDDMKGFDSVSICRRFKPTTSIDNIKFSKIVKESVDEMTPEEYAEAGQICRSLLREIGADDSQNNIFDIIENANRVDPNEIEINGSRFERIEDGKVVVYDYSQPNHERHIDPQDIDWIRVEGYHDRNSRADILYVYLHLNKSKSMIDQNNIQFDYYPDPNSDDYADSVEYSTCREYMTNGMVSEAEEGGYASDHPRIYVGTYAKYNDGSIDGKWIDISEYNTYEEFVDACRELHADEEDPEFMVQDYENFPERWYHEGGLPTEEEFNKINDFYLMDDSEKSAYEEYIDLGHGDDPESFRDAYIGEFSDPEEFGAYAVENWGMPQDRDSYFDYDSFGRDLTMDWHQGDPDETDAEGEPEDPDYYYDGDGYMQEAYGSDSEVGESYVDGIGGVDQLGKDTIDTYFDYEAFGRDLLISDCTESNGYVFWNH